MIRLTVNAQSKPQVHLFNQAAIRIGAAAEHSDLVVEGPVYAISVGLLITEMNGCFILFNQTNDPFLSLNGHPFGRKLLNTGDVILVGETEILFENLDTAAPVRKTESSYAEQVPPIFLDVSLPFEGEVKGYDEKEWQEIEPLMEKHEEEATLPPKQPPVSSLKDDYLKEWEDHSGLSRVGRESDDHLFMAWRTIVIFIVSLVMSIFVGGALLYFSLSDQKQDQEVLAMQAMADLAASLSYARLYHLHPANQNWADADFLHVCLEKLLEDTHSLASEIASNGQFRFCPYSLRVYTNPDLSRFLLIGQPAPSLWHWLLPKSAILIDSRTMKLHITKDIRHLNRLLAHSNPLEGSNGKAILDWIKQHRVVSLAWLAANTGKVEFCCSKKMGQKNGIENLIYNAPRYRRLGKSLTDLALRLSKTPDPQALLRLRERLADVAALPHLVLYAEDKKKASLIAEVLGRYSQGEALSVGYLGQEETPQKGRTELWKDKSLQSPVNSRFFRENPEIASLEEPSRRNPAQESALFRELQKLTLAREQELSPLAQLLSAVLQEEILQPLKHSEQRASSLLATFYRTNHKHNQKIWQRLQCLQSEKNHTILDWNGSLSLLQLEGLAKKQWGQKEPTVLYQEHSMPNPKEPLLSYLNRLWSVKKPLYSVDAEPCPQNPFVPTCMPMLLPENPLCSD